MMTVRQQNGMEKRNKISMTRCSPIYMYGQGFIEI